MTSTDAIHSSPLDSKTLDDTERSKRSRDLSAKLLSLFRGLQEGIGQDRQAPMHCLTPRLKSIARKLSSRLKSDVKCDSARSVLDMFKPTVDRDAIVKRQEICGLAVRFNDAVSIDLPALENIATLRNDILDKHNGIAVAIADEALYEKWRSELSSQFFTVFIESENDLASVSQYDEVRFIPGDDDRVTQAAEELEQTIIIRQPEELEDVAPERVTDSVLSQQEQLETLKSVEPLIDFSHTTPEQTSIASSNLSPEHLQRRIETVKSELESAITAEVKNAQFSGEHMIGILEQQTSVLDLLPEANRKRILELKSELLASAKEELGLDISTTFNISTAGKVDLDRFEVEKRSRQLQSEAQSNEFDRKRSLASEARVFVRNIPVVREEVAFIESAIAIGRFIEKYDLHKPSLDGKPGATFCQGRNMDLERPAPIEYQYGGPDKVTVVTGANSGGKTTLLELLIQIQLLAQSGLFVPARDATIGIVDSAYYFSKSKGSAGAGAFEQLLKQFASLNDGKQSRTLIFADEIESVTEPDIAAKIINTIIDNVQREQDTAMVLVTHMGKELSTLGSNARFDGIQAKGLDKEFNLIVERNPVIGCVARSTPQLIIERLAKTRNNPFYKELFESVRE